MKIPFVPSAANFVLVKVGDGRAVFQALLKQQIIVRALKGYNLPEWVRISIGTMEQNRKCIAALREILLRIDAPSRRFSAKPSPRSRLRPAKARLR